MKNQYEINYQQGYDKANEEWLARMDKMRAEIIAISGDLETIAVVLGITDKYKGESV